MVFDAIESMLEQHRTLTGPKKDTFVFGKHSSDLAWLCAQARKGMAAGDGPALTVDAVNALIDERLEADAHEFVGDLLEIIGDQFEIHASRLIVAIGETFLPDKLGGITKSS